MRLLRLSPALALAAALAACSANPVASETDDGGLPTGSGAASASESTADGGILAGSGNYAGEVNGGQGGAIPHGAGSYAEDVNEEQGGVLAGPGFESTGETASDDDAGNDGAQRGTIMNGSGL
jgi:hypothetical protein